MKQLAFEIAQKIATNNKCPHTVYICTAILKDVFIKEGYTDFQSNTMAVDGIKLIVKTMFKISNLNYGK